jgi:hypothetical protein
MPGAAAGRMSLQITPSLKDSLGTLYFKESCDQAGWAHLSLRDAGAAKDNNNNVFAFAKGERTIMIKIPAQAVQEVARLGRPAKGKLAFDYLACKVGGDTRRSGEVVVANPLGLCWVKMGRKGAFSADQIDAMEKTGLQVAVFAIRDVLAAPGKVQVRMDVRPAKEWLDELDDLRDQAESDDDYL